MRAGLSEPHNDDDDDEKGSPPPKLATAPARERHQLGAVHGGVLGTVACIRCCAIL